MICWLPHFFLPIWSFFGTFLLSGVSMQSFEPEEWLLIRRNSMTGWPCPQLIISAWTPSWARLRTVVTVQSPQELKDPRTRMRIQQQLNSHHYHLSNGNGKINQYRLVNIRNWKRSERPSANSGNVNWHEKDGGGDSEFETWDGQGEKAWGRHWEIETWVSSPIL